MWECIYSYCSELKQCWVTATSRNNFCMWSTAALTWVLHTLRADPDQSFCCVWSSEGGRSIGSLLTAWEQQCTMSVECSRRSACSPCPPATFNLYSWMILGGVIWACWMLQYCKDYCNYQPFFCYTENLRSRPAKKNKEKWENPQCIFLVDLPNSNEVLGHCQHRDKATQGCLTRTLLDA